MAWPRRWSNRERIAVVGAKTAVPTIGQGGILGRDLLPQARPVAPETQDFMGATVVKIDQQLGVVKVTNPGRRVEVVRLQGQVTTTTEEHQRPA